MKLLVGIVNFSSAKAYAVPKLLEMMKACVEPLADHIVVVGDTPIGGYDFVSMHCDSAYADDMLTIGREHIRKMAIDGGYDKMLWQGVDCYWQEMEDLREILRIESSVISALTSARDNADHAIARRFISHDGDQVDIPERELETENILFSGFMGADAIVIDRKVFEYPFAEGHVPWYRRVELGQSNLCVEENWVLNLHKQSVYDTFVHAGIRVWHCHEDGIARMWKGIKRPMSELSW